MLRLSVLALLPLVFSLAVKPVCAAAPPPDDSEAEQAIRGFQLPKGFKAELVAGDSKLANPVAFTIDEQGRFYIAETFRFNAGVPDIRERMHWLDSELASKSVADRLAYTKRFEPNNDAWWTNKEDRISLLWDSDGDGKVDQSKVFSGGYRGMLDGIGSGVLARRGDVYYADIPHLWLLRDTNHDGTADFKKSLSEGYGVRIGYIGHDLHGLIVGPDGRLYYSIGDRGAHITLGKGKDLDNSECGAVFRCELDGSNLEIFYTGLRNPQELAFDDYGNLWTCDNNSDAGDPARVVYVAEGGDAGWRVGWQFIDHFIPRSSWLAERLCYEHFPERAAYALPPVSSKVGNGPSGLAYDPGIGLPSAWRGKFFLANFSGHRESGILAFSVKPRGAGFALEKSEKFWWKFLPTDIEFGHDGAIYASDWINGWEGLGRGRLYRLYQPDERQQPAVAESRKLFAEGFRQRTDAELVTLLAHADRRVRQEAQFALVEHKATDRLAQTAASGSSLLARLHAVWGLGQLERQGGRANFTKLLTDPEPEVRSQAAKVLGDARKASYEKQLVKMLRDSEPRPRYFAAMALGKLGSKKGVPAVATMLRATPDDPWLRHAGVMALMHGAKEKDLLAFASDASVNVRLAAVVALRRLASPKLEVFLNDSNPQVVAEAARAINDLPLTSALPALAALADQRAKFVGLPGGTKEQPSPRDAILRRVINANFRLGTEVAARRVAEMAADESLTEMLREEAIMAFNDWSKPNGKDHVSGLWRPLPARSAVDFAAIAPVLKKILGSSESNKVKTALLEAAAKLGWRGLEAPVLAMWQTAAPKTQAAALEYLGAISSSRLDEALTLAGDSKADEVRVAAVKLATKTMSGEKLLRLLETVARTGTIREQQNVLQIMGGLNGTGPDQFLARELDSLIAGKLHGELQLELLEAAAKRNEAQVKTKLAQFQGTRAGQTGAVLYAECLLGGDAERGKSIFKEKAEASCIRCHKIRNEGGEAAPDLTKIGARADRNYILESITFPNAKIATGFETIQVVLTNGLSNVGIVKKETADQLDLFTQEDGLVKINKHEIKSRVQTLSGMLDNLRNVLTKREIRDLVEYLASLK